MTSRYRSLRLLSLLAGLMAAGAIHADTLKIATIAPDGSQWMSDLRGAAREIKEATDGRVTLKFYAGGVMGNEKKVLRKIRIGQLQGGAFTATGIAERYIDLLVYGLPLMFRSYDEVEWVRERMDPQLTKGLDDAGFVSFGFATAGFAKIMGSSPVAGLDDLKGRKIWVPEGDRVSYVAMEELELAPVVLPITDVLTGLQTGLLEYVATPPVGALVLQWHTKVKYVTDLPLAYTVGLMAVDKRAFSRLGDADQKVVRTVMERTYRESDQRAREDNAEAEKALQANGLKMVEPNLAEVERMREAALSASRKLAADGAFSAEVLDRVLAYLDEYRGGADGARARASE